MDVARNRGKVAATDATCSMAKQITHQSCHRVKRCTLRLIASEAADETSSLAPARLDRGSSRKANNSSPRGYKGIEY